MPVDKPRIERAVKEILAAIGEDPQRSGLKGTPQRVSRAWAEFIDYRAGKLGTCFEASRVDQMIVIGDIEAWSYCEHHLLPFRVKAAIGYIPSGKVLGLSKFGRIVHEAAHRLQIQEGLTHDIAVKVRDLAGTGDVAVLLQGEHLCMSMRGIRTPAVMTTSVVWGAFRDNPVARGEFKSLVSGLR